MIRSGRWAHARITVLTTAAYAAALISGCASARAQGALSYPVAAAQKVDATTITSIRASEGVLFGSGRTFECPPDICARIVECCTNYSEGRLSPDGYFALRSEGGVWSLRVANDFASIAQGTSRTWPQSEARPAGLPALNGYTLQSTVSLPATKDLFLGSWRSEGAAKPEYVLALFSGQPGKQINIGGKSRRACIFATTDAQVQAVGARLPMHGEMRPISILLYSKGGDHAHQLDYIIFPNSLRCEELPGQ